MNTRLYTKDEVFQVVEEVLNALDYSKAPALEPEYLDNDIPQNSSPENTKLTLTVPEAARIVGICNPKMYELVRAGKIRSIKVGKKILISRKSLTDWVEKGDSYGKEAC